MIRDRIRRGARRLERGLRRRLAGTDGPVDEVVLEGSRASTAAPPASPLAPTSPPAPTPPPAAASSPEPQAPESPEVGPQLTTETVQALFEDMVRPALQSDGGDIDLVKVEHGDVYVRLVGACSTCPSSTITMKMGIERLLEEEFPGFRSLIQVNGAA